MMRILRQPLDVMRAHSRALLALSLGYAALFGLGILITVLVPELRPGGLGALQGESGGGGLGTVIGDAYRSGNVLVAAAVTLAVNLLFASMLQTTLPTLIIPFLGVALTLLRGLSWGILFSPAGAQDASFLIHWVTLLIEGAAYVLVGFAAWVQGRLFLQPKKFGFASHRAGYVGGLVATAKLYIPVFILLVIGAVYEAVSVIFFIA